MKQIFLYKGRGKNKTLTDVFALVDDSDYEYLMQWKWGYMKLYHCKSDILYANRYEYIDGKTNSILMHRFIMKLTNKSEECDHSDGNTLNNQRNNLRVSTHSQNMSNRIKKTQAASVHLGVIFLKNKNRWMAVVKHNNVAHKSKSFKNELDAAKEYNKMALNFKGEFAKLNII